MIEHIADLDHVMDKEQFDAKLKEYDKCFLIYLVFNF